MSDGSPPDVVFEGNSREVIRSFPKDIRSELGADLDRVQNGEKPLDSAPMAPVLPGVFELRDEDPDFWYRVLYKQIDGAVYVLHCFRKKTNKTSLNDIKIAREGSVLNRGMTLRFGPLIAPRRATVRSDQSSVGILVANPSIP